MSANINKRLKHFDCINASYRSGDLDVSAADPCGTDAAAAADAVAAAAGVGQLGANGSAVPPAETNRQRRDGTV